MLCLTLTSPVPSLSPPPPPSPWGSLLICVTLKLLLLLRMSSFLPPPLPFYPPATSAPTRCLLSRELLLCLSSLSLGPPIAFFTLSHPLLWPLVSLLVHLPFSLSPLQKCGLFLLDACYCKPLCLVSSNICSGAWPVAQSGKHSILPGL